jgi:hypothetical protein
MFVVSAVTFVLNSIFCSSEILLFCLFKSIQFNFEIMLRFKLFKNIFLFVEYDLEIYLFYF